MSQAPAPPATATALPTQTLFGYPLTCASLKHATQYFRQLALQAQQEHQSHLIAHADVHLLTQALNQPWTYGIKLRHFTHICPDGMPLVWLLQQKHAQKAQRLYGPDLMETLMKSGRRHQLRHFLLGGSEHAQQQLSINMKKRNPGLNIVGQHSPPMGKWAENENQTILEKIRRSHPHCIWVALGCPKQEQWLADMRDELPPGLYFGVGAAFNFHAGIIPQAPLWMRSRGLEWIYRLWHEPQRLLKRYFKHNQLLLWYLLTRRI